MKEVKPQASELPDVNGQQADGGTQRKDPNVVPSEDAALMAELGITLANRLKRGRYGVVFEAQFNEAFAVDRLATGDKLHYIYVRPEMMDNEQMRVGHKLAIKFCDIESRKAYHIEDVEQRIHQEIDFFRRVNYEPNCAVVQVFFVLATSPTRYYIAMELANDNLQCLAANCAKHKIQLPPGQVLHMYECLLSTVKALHQQKLTYGMMRTSNILLFGQTNITASDGPTIKVDFRVKIADFVRSLDLNTPDLKQSTVDDAIEEDLDDLFYRHYELFALAQFDFAKYQAIKESIKILTDINAHRNSNSTLDKALEMVRTFARQHQHDEPAEQAN